MLIITIRIFFVSYMVTSYDIGIAHEVVERIIKLHVYNYIYNRK